MEIRKLKEEEILEYNSKSEDPNDYINLWAGECMDCGCEEIKLLNFVLSYQGKLEDVDFDEVENIIMQKTGCENLGIKSTDLGTVLDVSRCPSCGSQDIFSDI
jgi:hypothetical protein